MRTQCYIFYCMIFILYNLYYISQINKLGICERLINRYGGIRCFHYLLMSSKYFWKVIRKARLCVGHNLIYYGILFYLVSLSLNIHQIFSTGAYHKDLTIQFQRVILHAHQSRLVVALSMQGVALKKIMHANLLRAFVSYYHLLPPFQNIRCFSFVKQMYLDIF
jgi:hypothetical protein